MTTPASRLRERLIPGHMLDIRGLDGKLEVRVSYTDAIAQAINGDVEGVGPPSGRILFLRRLKPEAKEPVIVAAPLDDGFAVADRPGAALVTHYLDHCGDTYVHTLHKTRGGSFAKWKDTDGFNPFRFNPDRIAAPLTWVGLGLGRIPCLTSTPPPDR